MIDNEETIFLENKYFYTYFNIIENAISANRERVNGDYYENHHIYPVSLFPLLEKIPSNLVFLTAREHFICHILLTKFTSGNEKYKMLCAVNFMNRSKSPNHKNYYLNSRLYEANRQKFAEEQRIRMTGNTFSDETLDKMSKSAKRRGISLSAREKMRISMTGKKFTKEHKEKLSDLQRGKNGKIWSGWWVTPWGTFETAKEATKSELNTNNVTYDTLSGWCKIRNEMIISKHSISRLTYLKSLGESVIGKTPKDLGFGFIPKEEFA